MAGSDDIGNLKERIAELEQQLVEEREEYEWDLKAAKESSAGTVRKLEEELVALKRSSARPGKGKASSSEVEMLTQRALMAERRVAELQEELKRASNLAPPPAPRDDPLLRQRAEEAERERDGLRKEKRALERSLEKVKKEVGPAAELKQEAQQLKAALAERDKELTELRSTSSNLAEKDKKVRELAQELNNLASVEAERDGLQKDIAGVRKELDGAKKDLAKREAEVKKLKSKRDKKGGRRERELEERAVAAEDGMRQVQEELAHVKMASGQMLQQRDREIERLKNDVTSVKGRQEVSSEKTHGLNDELQRLRDELAGITTERDELALQLRSLRDRETVIKKAPAAPGPDIFDEQTQRAASPLGAGLAPELHPQATGVGTVQDAHTSAMPVVPGALEAGGVPEAENLFLEDETTKKTERVRFSQGTGTEQQEVPPSPKTGAASEEELAPPAVSAAEIQGTATGDSEENPTEAEIVPAGDSASTDADAELESWMQGGGSDSIEVSLDAAPADATDDTPRKPPTPIGAITAAQSTSTTEPEGLPPMAEPVRVKSGGGFSTVAKAVVLGLVFGGIVVAAFLLFPKWFGPKVENGDEGSAGGAPPVVAEDAGVATTGADVAAPATPVDAGSQDGAVVVAVEPDASEDVGEDEGEDVEPGEGGDEPTPEVLAARQRGLTLLKRKKYKGALKFIKPWVEREPEDATLRYLLGRAYFYRKKIKASVRELEKAVELDPKLTHAYYELAGVYLKARQRDQACEAMRMFIRLEPDSKRAKGVRGNLRKLRCP